MARFGNNKYPVNASAVGRPAEIHAIAGKFTQPANTWLRRPSASSSVRMAACRRLRRSGYRVADHPRAFGRGAAIFGPWHYVPVLSRKPGAPGNGAPFKDWVLPGSLERIRRNPPA